MSGSVVSKFKQYKYRANSKAMSFKIKEEEFKLLESTICFYCGDSSNIGIDRIDNNEGYLATNSVPACWRCNRAKNNMEIQEFTEWLVRLMKTNYYLIDERLSNKDKIIADFRKRIDSKVFDLLYPPPYIEDLATFEFR